MSRAHKLRVPMSHTSMSRVIMSRLKQMSLILLAIMSRPILASISVIYVAPIRLGRGLAWS